jgi:hypothetical protein
MATKRKAPSADADGYDVATAIGNGDRELVDQGVSVTMMGDQAVLIPMRIRGAPPAQLRLIAALQDLVRLHLTTLEQLDECVAAARSAGLSWASIAWCVGLSEAGARKRWGT